jgi:8-oxo-dGTP pyrophosphatase MutT (NUDIX family)
VRWTVHGERHLYTSDWMSMVLVDVEPPGTERFEHHIVRFPRSAAGAIVFDPDRGVLLLWRHRFATDAWGWEVPAGRLDEGESPEAAAARETFEETGWRPGPLEHVVTFNPAAGVTDLVFHAYLARGATHVGEPHHPEEAERVEWVPVDALRDELRAGRVLDGLSVAGLGCALAFGMLEPGR